MGLGKKGLPESFLKSVPYHLEHTGKDVALETATAMGVIAEQLRSKVSPTHTPQLLRYNTHGSGSLKSNILTSKLKMISNRF